MHRIALAVALALAGHVAHATNVANAVNENGTQIVLTDERLYNPCGIHGWPAVAYIIKRDGSEQPACYGIDWDSQVVTFMPLIPRSNSERTWGAIGSALIGDQRGVNAASSHYDMGDRFTVPTEAFTWATNESQGWIKASPP